MERQTYTKTIKSFIEYEELFLTIIKEFIEETFKEDSQKAFDVYQRYIDNYGHDYEIPTISHIKEVLSKWKKAIEENNEKK